MAIKTIYHGSDRVIEYPKFGVGNKKNDYGLGFYCTESLEMAKEWAVGRGTSGFANEYRFIEDDLNVVDLESDKYCTLHWLSLLLENRVFDIRAPLALDARKYLLENFHVDISNTDIVKGYRADDSYFTFANDFIMGAISYRQLQNAMKLGKLGRQIMIKSPSAFERLEFVDAIEASLTEWLPRREERDRRARLEYLEGERFKRMKGDLYITSILDEEMRFGDARLQ